MSVLAYEKRLRADFDWALQEGSMHFQEKSDVQKTLRAVAKRLDDIGVPYAVCGGMALYYHGYERFTTDVDIIVTKESLATIHDRLEGLGYVPPFEGSKNLRDTSNGVRIEFLVSGDYPGDGLPKPVSFPDPKDVAVEVSGMKFLALPTLIELKLASGVTNPLRIKDIADVQELIVALKLGEDVAEHINPFVRQKYLDLVHIYRTHSKPPE